MVSRRRAIDLDADSRLEKPDDTELAMQSDTRRSGERRFDIAWHPPLRRLRTRVRRKPTELVLVDRREGKPPVP
jgi:hypothetical protein